MNATLDSVDRAIFETLQGLLASSGGGPFQSVIRYSGETTGRDKQLVQATLGVTPAVMLAWEGWGDGEEIDDTLLTQQGAFVMPSVWRVFVVHSELAGHDEAVTGQIDSPGILGLVQRVTIALAGLSIPGLYNGSRLIPKKGMPVHVKPGEYVCMSRFLANLFLDGTSLPDASKEFDGVTGGIHLVEEVGVPNPINSFDVSIETE